LNIPGREADKTGCADIANAVGEGIKRDIHAYGLSQLTEKAQRDVLCRISYGRTGQELSGS
jgi:hypothetical protein